MKVEGLGEKRRGVLSQISHLVREAKDFSGEHFDRMVASYKDEDVTLHQILSEAKDQANNYYTRYLDSRIWGSPIRATTFGFSPDLDEGPTLAKVGAELRERLKDQSEFRQQFLAPQIDRVSNLYDRQLRKTQKEEIKKQREELKVKSKSQRKGFNPFGLGF